MEAVFILTELRTKFAAEQLTALAANLAADSELRQAAIWGLGFAGHRRYEAILPHIAVQDDNVALHAIGAFGPDTPRAIVAELTRRLDRRSPRVASAASEALRLIGNAEVVASVADILLQGQPETLDWAIATLGRLDAPAVRGRLNGTSAMSVIEPLLQLYGPDNWLAHGDRPVSLSFLLGQRLTT